MVTRIKTTPSPSCPVVVPSPHENLLLAIFRSNVYYRHWYGAGGGGTSSMPTTTPSDRPTLREDIVRYRHHIIVYWLVFIPLWVCMSYHFALALRPSVWPKTFSLHGTSSCHPTWYGKSLRLHLHPLLARIHALDSTAVVVRRFDGGWKAEPVDPRDFACGKGYEKGLATFEIVWNWREVSSGLDRHHLKASHLAYAFPTYAASICRLELCRLPTLRHLQRTSRTTSR